MRLVAVIVLGGSQAGAEELVTDRLRFEKPASWVVRYPFDKGIGRLQISDSAEGRNPSGEVTMHLISQKYRSSLPRERMVTIGKELKFLPGVDVRFHERRDMRKSRTGNTPETWFIYHFLFDDRYTMIRFRVPDARLESVKPTIKGILRSIATTDSEQGVDAHSAAAVDSEEK